MWNIKVLEDKILVVYTPSIGPVTKKESCLLPSYDREIIISCDSADQALGILNRLDNLP